MNEIERVHWRVMDKYRHVFSSVTPILFEAVFINSEQIKKYFWEFTMKISIPGSRQTLSFPTKNIQPFKTRHFFFGIRLGCIGTDSDPLDPDSTLKPQLYHFLTLLSGAGEQCGQAGLCLSPGVPDFLPRLLPSQVSFHQLCCGSGTFLGCFRNRIHDFRASPFYHVNSTAKTSFNLKIDTDPILYLISYRVHTLF